MRNRRRYAVYSSPAWRGGQWASVLVVLLCWRKAP